MASLWSVYVYAEFYCVQHTKSSVNTIKKQEQDLHVKRNECKSLHKISIQLVAWNKHSAKTECNRGGDAETVCYRISGISQNGTECKWSYRAFTFKDFHLDFSGKYTFSICKIDLSSLQTVVWHAFTYTVYLHFSNIQLSIIYRKLKCVKSYYIYISESRYCNYLHYPHCSDSRPHPGCHIHKTWPSG